MNGLLANILQVLQRFNQQQKIFIVTMILVLISGLVVLMLWANRPDYELLYSNLDPGSASAIVDDLRSNSIPYELKNGGRTIYVPRESIAEMRLKYIQSDFMKDGITGYELFETNSMGMTTFMQRLNMRRALEGELSRTINHLPEVIASRVHLVIAEERLFEEDKAGSASVVVQLKPGASLNQRQVSGIIALVANSVQNLAPADVVVLGSNGVVFSQSANDGIAGNAGSKWELQNTIETEFQAKITGIVEGVVGYQNSVVNVSVDLNLDQVERTIEAVDPDKTAVLSEETFLQDDNAEGAAKSERVISNYELSKTLERHISTSGDIRKISVAVLVNGQMVTETVDGEDVQKYVPRTVEELEEIAALVRTSIGFSEERGDQVEVRNLPFNKEMLVSEQAHLDKMLEEQRFDTYIVYGVAAVGVLVIFFVLRMLLNSSLQSLPPAFETNPETLAQGPGAAAAPLVTGAPVAEGGVPAINTAGTVPGAVAEAGTVAGAVPGAPEGTAAVAAAGAAVAPAVAGQPQEEEVSEDIYIRKLSPEAKARLKASDYMTEEITKFVEESPEDAARLIRSWMVG